MIKFFSAFIFFCFSLFLITISGAVHSEEGTSITLSGKLKESNKLISKSFSGDMIIPAGEYKVSVNATLKKTISRDVSNQLLFQGSEINTVIDKFIDDSITFYPDSGHSLDSLQKDFLNADQYNQLWVDYEVIGSNDPRLIAEINIDTGKSKDKYKSDNIVVSNNGYLSEIEKENFISSDWIVKDNIYLLGRLFGMFNDKKWRYKYLNSSTVLQRRFDKVLLNPSAVKIILNSGVSVERVNLRVDDGFSNRVVGWENISKDIRVDDFGRTHIIMWPYSYSNIANKRSITLKEVVVFVSGNNINHILKKQKSPIQSVHYMGRIPICKTCKNKEKFVNAQATINQLNDKVKRLKVNFEKDVNRGRIKGLLRSIKLYYNNNLEGETNESLIKIKEVKLVNVHNQALPIILKPSDGVLTNNKFSFYKEYNWMDVDKKIILKRQTKKGFLENMHDIEFNVDTTLKPDRWIFFDFKNYAKNIKSIEVSLFNKDIFLGKWYTEGAKALNLDLEKKIDRVKARIFLKNKETNVKLVNAFIFNTKKINIENVFNQDFFLKNALNIEHIDGNVFGSKIKDNSIKIFYDKELQKSPLFRTVVSNSRENKNSNIDIVYKMNQLYSVDKICFLKAIMVGNGKQDERIICATKGTGNIQQKIPEWVEYVDWHVLFPLGSKENDIIFLELYSVIPTLGYNYFSKAPLVKFYDKLLRFESVKQNGYQIQLNLNVKEDTDLNINNIEIVDNKLIKVSNILFERVKPYTLNEWNSITDIKFPINNSASWLWKLLFAIFFISLMCKLIIPLYEFFKKILRNLRCILNWSTSLLLWTSISILMYGIGIYANTMEVDNYWITIGGMSVVLVWRALIEYIKPIMHSKYPVIAEKIYGGAGTQYFSGFIVVLVGVMVMLVLKLEPIAEQLAIIGYYMLVVGVVLEVFALRKDKSEGNNTDSLGT